MPNAPSILVIDDEQGILETLRILLKNEGFDVETAQGGKAGLEKLKSGMPDILITDVRMPGVSGIEILKAAKEEDPEAVVIMMTAQADMQATRQALNEGAYYHILKPFGNDELLAVCKRAVEHRLLRAENKQLKQEIKRRERSGRVHPLGTSKVFKDVLRLAEQVAPTESTVLIQGESGTGKEVIARHLHELSPRADGPFLSINCGALPESLLESELFGHVKGSFTGAVRDKQGLFAAARGGTFFLDEIGEMSPATQVKLLRVLQEREAIPVGGTEAIPVDVRVVAATNRNLEDDIKRGRFRSDLYYRLNVINIHLPPLRDRREDIEELATEFLGRVAKQRGEEPKAIAKDTMEVIMAYDWPGNVRELENALERAVTLTKGDTIPRSAIPDKISERKSEPLVGERPHKNPSLDVIEQAYITWVLQSEGGNKTRAAEVLGIDPSTLYRKLSRYDGSEKKNDSESSESSESSPSSAPPRPPVG
jgi:two-component system response regulator HydG